MPGSIDHEESLPLLSPIPSSSGHHQQPTLSPASRSKLGARRHISLPLTEKAKGKQRATETDRDIDLEAQNLTSEPNEIDQGDATSSGKTEGEKVKEVEVRGRRITIIFSNEGKEGNLELWVEPGETVGSVKDQVSTLCHHHILPSKT